MESVNNLTAVIVEKQPGIIPFVYDDMCVKPLMRRSTYSALVCLL
jgi:hypothetical protein